MNTLNLSSADFDSLPGEGYHPSYSGAILYPASGQYPRIGAYPPSPTAATSQPRALHSYAHQVQNFGHAQSNNAHTYQQRQVLIYNVQQPNSTARRAARTNYRYFLIPQEPEALLQVSLLNPLAIVVDFTSPGARHGIRVKDAIDTAKAWQIPDAHEAVCLQGRWGNYRQYHFTVRRPGHLLWKSIGKVYSNESRTVRQLTTKAELLMAAGGAVHKFWSEELMHEASFAHLDPNRDLFILRIDGIGGAEMMLRIMVRERD